VERWDVGGVAVAVATATALLATAAAPSRRGGSCEPARHSRRRRDRERETAKWHFPTGLLLAGAACGGERRLGGGVGGAGSPRPGPQPRASPGCLVRAGWLRLAVPVLGSSRSGPGPFRVFLVLPFYFGAHVPGKTSGCLAVTLERFSWPRAMEGITSGREGGKFMLERCFLEEAKLHFLRGCVLVCLGEDRLFREGV